MFNPKHWDYDPKVRVKAGLEGPKKAIPASILEMTKKFREELPKPYDLSKITAQIGDWLCLNQEALLLAWFAQYGFEPGKAVLCHGFDLEMNSTTFYIREATEKEKAEMNKAFNKAKEREGNHG